MVVVDVDPVQAKYGVAAAHIQRARVGLILVVAADHLVAAALVAATPVPSGSRTSLA